MPLFTLTIWPNSSILDTAAFHVHDLARSKQTPETNWGSASFSRYTICPNSSVLNNSCFHVDDLAKLKHSEQHTFSRSRSGQAQANPRNQSGACRFLTFHDLAKLKHPRQCVVSRSRCGQTEAVLGRWGRFKGTSRVMRATVNQPRNPIVVITVVVIGVSFGESDYGAA